MSAKVVQVHHYKAARVGDVMREAQLNSRVRVIFIFIMLAVLLVWNWVGWPYKLRFSYVPVNYFVYALLCIAFLVSAVAAAATLKHRATKIVAALGCVLLALPCLVLSFLAIMQWRDVVESGIDHSYTFIRELESNLGTYRLYRTNCGATCAYGLELRKEIDTPLGVKLVKPVWQQYRADDAYLASTGEAIRIIHNGVVMAEVR